MSSRLPSASTASRSSAIMPWPTASPCSCPVSAHLASLASPQTQTPLKHSCLASYEKLGNVQLSLHLTGLSFPHTLSDSLVRTDGLMRKESAMSNDIPSLEKLEADLAEMAEKSFPKKCVCGREYDNLQDFLARTGDTHFPSNILHSTSERRWTKRKLFS